MMIEQKSMARPTGALLTCGVLAGPLYIAVTAVQALTRAGFDLSQHRYNLLTTGDLGGIHRTNMVVTGMLTVLFAVGVGRLLRQGRSARWAPRLLGLFGLAYVVGGLFPADPVIGFPPGTLTESTTWHGIVNAAARGVSSLLLIAASLVIARWFTSRGLRNWTWFSWAAVPMSLGAFVLLVVAGADTSTTYVAFLVPGILMWVWVTAVAVYLYRLGERQAVVAGPVRQGVPA
ncbi:DUF998 domain-containing protein [Nocardia brasiliensis]|uniref:DUF998 domain-containing protein n=1 Tax=Nocardia brasiliensis TaxID=37326 RepID=UPI00366C196B